MRHPANILIAVATRGYRAAEWLDDHGPYYTDRALGRVTTLTAAAMYRLNKVAERNIDRTVLGIDRAMTRIDRYAIRLLGDPYAYDIPCNPPPCPTTEEYRIEAIVDCAPVGPCTCGIGQAADLLTNPHDHTRFMRAPDDIAERDPNHWNHGI
jgi:hypothetical protein